MKRGIDEVLIGHDNDNDDEGDHGTFLTPRNTEADGEGSTSICRGTTPSNDVDGDNSGWISWAVTSITTPFRTTTTTASKRQKTSSDTPSSTVALPSTTPYTERRIGMGTTPGVGLGGTTAATPLSTTSRINSPLRSSAVKQLHKKKGTPMPKLNLQTPSERKKNAAAEEHAEEEKKEDDNKKKSSVSSLLAGIAARDEERQRAAAAAAATSNAPLLRGPGARGTAITSSWNEPAWNPTTAEGIGNGRHRTPGGRYGTLGDPSPFATSGKKTPMITTTTSATSSLFQTARPNNNKTNGMDQGGQRSQPQFHIGSSTTASSALTLRGGRRRMISNQSNALVPKGDGSKLLVPRRHVQSKFLMSSKTRMQQERMDNAMKRTTSRGGDNKRSSSSLEMHERIKKALMEASKPLGGTDSTSLASGAYRGTGGTSWGVAPQRHYIGTPGASSFNRLPHPVERQMFQTSFVGGMASAAEQQQQQGEQRQLASYGQPPPNKRMQSTPYHHMTNKAASTTSTTTAAGSNRVQFQLGSNDVKTPDGAAAAAGGVKFGFSTPGTGAAATFAGTKFASRKATPMPTRTAVSTDDEEEENEEEPGGTTTQEGGDEDGSVLSEESDTEEEKRYKQKMIGQDFRVSLDPIAVDPVLPSSEYPAPSHEATLSKVQLQLGKTIDSNDSLIKTDSSARHVLFCEDKNGIFTNVQGTESYINQLSFTEYWSERTSQSLLSNWQNGIDLPSSRMNQKEETVSKLLLNDVVKNVIETFDYKKSQASTMASSKNLEPTVLQIKGKMNDGKDLNNPNDKESKRSKAINIVDASTQGQPASGGWSSNMFGPKGNWKCNACFVSNPPESCKCMSCEAPKPDTAVAGGAAGGAAKQDKPSTTTAPATGKPSFFQTTASAPAPGAIGAGGFSFLPSSSSSSTKTPAPAPASGSIGKSGFTFGAAVKSVIPPSTSGSTSMFGTTISNDAGTKKDNDDKNNSSVGVTKNPLSLTGDAKSGGGFRFDGSSTTATSTTISNTGLSFVHTKNKIEDEGVTKKTKKEGDEGTTKNEETPATTTGATTGLFTFGGSSSSGGGGGATTSAPASLSNFGSSGVTSTAGQDSSLPSKKKRGAGDEDDKSSTATQRNLGFSFNKAPVPSSSSTAAPVPSQQPFGGFGPGGATAAPVPSTSTTTAGTPSFNFGGTVTETAASSSGATSSTSKAKRSRGRDDEDGGAATAPSSASNGFGFGNSTAAPTATALTGSAFGGPRAAAPADSTAGKTAKPDVSGLLNATTTKVSQGTAPTFNFGGASSTNNSSTAPTGASSTSMSGTSSPPFAFGAPAAAPVMTGGVIATAVATAAPADSKAAAPTSSLFGAGGTTPAPTTAPATTAVPTFNFGSNTAAPASTTAGTATTTPAATAPFTFGSTTAPSAPTAAAPPAASTSSFPFGAAAAPSTASSTAPPTTPSTTFGGAFGSSTTTPAAPSTTSAFGGAFGASSTTNTNTTIPAAASFGGFGASSSTNTTATPAFGAAPAPAGPFGSSTAATTTPSAPAPAFGGNSLFGAGPTPAPATNNAFGSSNTTTSTFGMPPQNSAPPTSSFGSSGAFGAAPTFGAAPAPATNSFQFGVPAATPAPAAGGMFGAVTTNPPTAFGATPTPSAPPSFGGAAVAPIPGLPPGAQQGGFSLGVSDGGPKKTPGGGSRHRRIVRAKRPGGAR